MTRPLCPSRPALKLFLMISASAIVAPTWANPALNGYADYETWRRQIEQIAESPAASVASLGTTLGGRDVFVLTIGLGDPDSKPALLIVGNAHEPQLVGSELATRIARKLARGGQRDGPVKELLQKVTFYVVPRPNPDGAQRLRARPWRERAGNDRRTDDDRDFRVGEDPPDDLNGDGWITMMRVRDETGPYMPHPHDSRILIKADAQKNERGQYKLYTEGRDDDHDQQYNEDAADGVSFNRNFTFDYPYFKPGAGPHQVSEIETRAIADFAFDHPNIALVFTFAPEDNLMHPWKADSAGRTSQIPRNVLADDAPYFELLSNRYREACDAKDAPASASGEGSLAKWAYFHYGRWSLAARAWWPSKAESEKNAEDEAESEGKDEGEKGKNAEGDGKSDGKRKSEREAGKDSDEKRGAEELAALRWMDREEIDGFVDWTRVKDPDFPGKRVEVGGFKPFYRMNPPARELDALADRHFDFLVDLTSLLPDVRIASTRTESLGQGVFRVVAVIANRGYLPTTSEMGRRSRRTYPLQVALELPKQAQLVQDSPRRRIERLAGNGGAVEQTWLVRLVRGNSAVAHLRIWAPALGSDEAVISLKKKR